MTTLIVRDLKDGLGAALRREAQLRSLSVNKLVHHYILTGLERDGSVPSVGARNDLARFAGRWSAPEQRAFAAATLAFNEVEPDLWK